MNELLDPLLIGLAVAGYVMHFALRWGEYRRITAPARIGLRDYVSLDPPGWIMATVGAVVCYIALPELDGLARSRLGLPEGVSVTATPLFAFLSGYVGSSVLPKLVSAIPDRLLSVFGIKPPTGDR